MGFPLRKGFEELQVELWGQELALTWNPMPIPYNSP